MIGLQAIMLLDLKRLWGRRQQVALDLVQPLLYLFVLGSGLGAASRQGETSYLQFIAPGIVGLTLLFTAVFSGISIVFDREAGFLKAILVAPVGRSTIAVAKVLSGAIQALLPSLVLLAVTPAIGFHLNLLRVPLFVGVMLLSALSFSSIGVTLAARFTSTMVFPVVINTILFPLFFVSGALYPLTGAPAWLRWLAYVDPVAYAVDLMRGVASGSFFFPELLSVGVLAVVTLVFSHLAAVAFGRGELE